MREKPGRLRIRLAIGLLIWLGTNYTGIHAQSVIPATGGNSSGSGGSVSYSAGQVVYLAQMGSTGSVLQGVQQPFEIFNTTGIQEVGRIKLEVSAHPNPADRILTLKIINQEIDVTGLSYQLCDLNGKLLENNKLTSHQTDISLEHRAPGTYLLIVTNCDGLLKKPISTFKIIKTERDEKAFNTDCNPSNHFDISRPGS